MATYRNELDSVMAGWLKFRRAMPAEEQGYIDRLMEMAMRHSHESSYMASPEPVEPILLSIMIELLKELDRLEGKGVAVGRLDDF